jgi:hypothetical protein
MAYSTANPPRMILPSFTNSSGESSLWTYSTADTAATVDTTGYITNGGALGMKVGDIVNVTVTGTGVITAHRVVTVSATAPGAVDLSDGTVIGSATNTD